MILYFSIKKQKICYSFLYTYINKVITKFYVIFIVDPYEILYPRKGRENKRSYAIVGFPRESYEHFLNLSYLHILTNSERENTEAFQINGLIF